MKELKRLFTGFLSALMVLSFILMPIPKINRAWAEEANKDCVENTENAGAGVYKAGCKLDDALTQTKMDTVYGSDDDKWTGYFQQAVFGMMSVVFLDNLFLKYLYAKDPTVYGNDCAENTAANYTIRGAQIAALAYIIGEVQANIKYKELSQNAVDLDFAAKDKTYMPSGDSPEVLEYKEKLAAGEDAGVDPRIQALKDNNAQEDAYDALIKILEAQAEAVKTKMRLTTTAEVALLAVEVMEWVSIAKCKGVCKETVLALKDEYDLYERRIDQSGMDLDNLKNSYIFELSKVKYPNECVQLKKILEQDKKSKDILYKNSEISGKENGIDVDKKDQKKNKKFMGIFASLAGIFQMNKIKDSKAANTSLYIAQQNEDEVNENKESQKYQNNTRQEGQTDSQDFNNVTNQITKCEDALKNQKPSEIDEEIEKKEGEIDAKNVEIDAKNVEMQANRAELASCIGPQAAACTAALDAEYAVLEGEKVKFEAEKEKLENEKELLNSDKNKAETQFAKSDWEMVKKGLGETHSAQFAFLFSRTSCCGLAGISTNEAQDVKQIIQNMDTSAENAGLEAVTKKINEIDSDMTKFITTYSSGQKVKSDAISGSFVHQGLTNDSAMSKRKDITKFNPLKKKSSFFNNAPKEGYTVEYIVPKIIENRLYDYSLRNFVNWESDNPILITEQINEITNNINKTSKAIEKQIEIDLHIPGPVLISETEKFQNFSKNVGTILSKFVPIQSAHAINARGAGMAIGGMAIGMLAKELGGPWAEVLNVGSKYLMLKAILNMLGVTELFLKPKSRALIWGALTLLSTAIIIFDNKALKGVEKNIAIVKAEKKRYKNSAVARTGLDSGSSRNSNAGAKLEKYDMTASRTKGMSVKACVVAKGDAFAPGNCPSIIPKQRVSLPEISNHISHHLTPDHLKGLSLTTDALYGAASGSDMGAESMSDSTLDKINNTRNALKNLAASLKSEYEKDENAKRARRGLKADSLNKTMANFKKSFSNTSGSSKSGFGGAAIGSSYKGHSKTASYSPRSKYKKKSGSSTGGSLKGSGKSRGGFDLDFGDDDSSSSSGLSKSKTKNKIKHSDKMRDYEIGMNDINARKEIPIWKILSNRYILSYPKLLEEDKAPKEKKK